MGEIYVTESVVAEVSTHFDAKKGDADYVYWMDINQDGVIDMKDIYYFANNLGKTVKVPQKDAVPWVPLLLLFGLFLFAAAEK